MHTLNEQSVTFAADTVAEVVNKIIAWLADTFGWTAGEGCVYPRSDKNLGIHFYLSSSALRIYAANSAYSTTVNTMSASLSTTVTVRFHVSAGESVKYFSISSGTSNPTTFIVAEADNGELYVIVMGTASDQWEMISEKAHTAATGGNDTPVDELLHYSVTKMPAVFNGGAMKELYMITSARVFSPTNFNIDFGNGIHRLVATKPSGKIPQFSFPVSEGE